MKILLVHGIGHSDADPNYYASWKQEITAGFVATGATAPDFAEFHYDDVFEQHYSGPGTYATAAVELLSTAAYHAVADPISDFIHGIFHPSRDLVYGGDTLRWHAGMVAQFAIEDGLRTDLRNLLFTQLSNEEPDLIAAHSLGSLLTFDFFHNDRRAQQFANVTYLTFGSQINNSFVRSRLWPGRLTKPAVRAWYHLYNRQDRIFTADISIPDDPAFHSIKTTSAAGHSPILTPAGPGYLDNPNTQKLVWPVLAEPAGARVARPGLVIADQALAKPKRRALLIGINDYPNPENRLNGCVNDTFLFSSLLQERGFAAEDIRVVLNERATADAIRERLAWLLEDAGDGMERVLFYSGHGAALPGYNALEKVDHVDECLVPYDFAWTKQTAITDDDFYDLYSDLPFSAKFFAVLDCCHAGGMTRDGSHKARGIAPPDDIRHRLLRWNKEEGMWQERKLNPINAKYGGTQTERKAMMGPQGSTYRLGRGMRLRQHTSKAESKKLVQEKRGLFLPVLLEACGEGQLWYEYRHGTVSYGAFTYSMVKNLRQNPGANFNQLIARTGKSLQALGYNDQTPQLVGPTKVVSKPLPGQAASK